MNILLRYVLVGLILFGCFGPTGASADWINFSGAENAPNIAEIYINDDHVRVELEIFVNDMVTFDRLIPETFFKGTDIKRPPMEERQQQWEAMYAKIEEEK